MTPVVARLWSQKLLEEINKPNPFEATPAQKVRAVAKECYRGWDWPEEKSEARIKVELRNALER